ncbi:purine-binding chemotaxis protein CheW [Algiphilus sp. NNCM1]|uniref:chemotaxis protein CheW n=1 Tax=Algiphilus sp. TaxID=1872431 RepID=UPI001CA6F5E1|nr:chemotaxis protein CheW [Algiphilus sp.]MBY8965602.1 purine-binding chemotaxis protein CheW [Algiphilus acroporae]MCI5104954.1 chemotaxis protein CheW [Algiphilus sp.]
MSDALRALRDQPFALLAQLDQQMRAARFEAGEEQFWTGLAFRLGDDAFVIPRSEAGEVLTLPAMTRVPGAADWLLGVANVRGDLLTVCDLRRLAGYPPTPPARDTRVIVFNQPQAAMGFVVDAVYGHRQFVPADQKHALADASEPPLRDWLLGAFVREGVSWRVLSLHRLAAAELLTQVAA